MDGMYNPIEVFRNVMSQLDNDSERIKFLTMVAVQSVGQAEQFVQIILDTYQRFSHFQEQQVNVLYVIDSIVKCDPSRTFVKLLQSLLPTLFVTTYQACHEQLRQNLLQLLNTWEDPFPPEIAMEIKARIQPSHTLIRMNGYPPQYPQMFQSVQPGKPPLLLETLSTSLVLVNRPLLVT